MSSIVERISLSSTKTALMRLLKFYAIFAAANLTLKWFLILRSYIRVRKLWKHLPGKDCDVTATELRSYGEKFHDFDKDYSARYYDRPLVKLPSPLPTLLFNTPEALEWLLKEQFDHISKPGPEDPLFSVMRKFLGSSGIFVLRHGAVDPQESELWHKERKVSSLIFTKANFETMMYDTFIDKGKIFQRWLESWNYENMGEAIDIQELFFSFTMDSIERFFLGKDVNTLEGGMSDYAKTFDAAHQSMVRHIINSIPITLANSFLLPYPFGALLPNQHSSSTIFTTVMRRFVINKDYTLFMESVEDLGKQIKVYIRNTRADPDIKSRKDIIANFLNSKIGDELTDDMLKDIVLNLTIAGRDTTACALSWMVYELTQNLDVQDKLCAEIKTVLQDRTPTMADIDPANMPYLNGVIYEALRLHPSVPTNRKKNDIDLVYKDGTVIPAGTALMFSTLGMGLNPVRYPNPTKFEPARWIPFKQPGLFEFPVFQAGPRFCLGKDMAQFEMKLLTCMIFQKFKFKLKAGEQITYTPMLTPSVSNDPKGLSQHLLVIPERLV